MVCCGVQMPRLPAWFYPSQYSLTMNCNSLEFIQECSNTREYEYEYEYEYDRRAAGRPYNRKKYY